MTHLTDEQFEDVLAGRMAEPAHVAACPTCSDRLAEHRALRARLQSTFAEVRAGDALAERIRRTIGQAAPAAPRTAAPAAHGHRRVHPISRMGWAAMATAAAVFVVAIPVLIWLINPSAAMAELVRIHTDNLQGHHAFFSDADPVHLAEYLKTQIGFEPATPRLGQGMAMRGCCVAHFKGSPVGSYVVDTPRGPISIIVVPKTPAEMGIDHAFTSGGKTFYADAFATNQMVTVCSSGTCYCAVGEVPQEFLTQILLNLGLGE
jgi:glycosyltransferase A (GT-A) superfamily protein (DUF2064 family)